MPIKLRGRDRSREVDIGRQTDPETQREKKSVKVEKTKGACVRKSCHWQP